MSMNWVRTMYNVPAARGVHVLVDGKHGVITSASNHIHVRFDGEKFSRSCHPKWKVEWLGMECNICESQSVINSSRT